MAQANSNHMIVKSLSRKRDIVMRKRVWASLFLLLNILLCSHSVFAESFFDFDEIKAGKKKTTHSAAIDAYMERVYGSNITVGSRAEVANNSGKSDPAAARLSAPADSFLKNGKGRNSGITLSFDASPISSFSVDSQVFRRGVGIIIKADGVMIYQHLLTKAEKRSGIMSSIDPIFLDKPIHTLEFIGIKKTKIGIDDLTVNLSQPADLDSLQPDGDPEDQLGADEAAQVAIVTEPSSFLMLGLGFLGVSWVSRRIRFKSRSTSSTTEA